MIAYILDDGGRARAGYKGNTGDCAVRALAILTGEPYSHVYARVAAAMKRAGYRASGNGYRQTPRPGLKPRLTARQVQNHVKRSYGLRRVDLGRGPRPTYTQAWQLHGNCLVGTTKHVAAIVDGALRDIFDHRVYDARIYGRAKDEQRKAQPKDNSRARCARSTNARVGRRDVPQSLPDRRVETELRWNRPMWALAGP